MYHQILMHLIYVYIYNSDFGLWLFIPSAVVGVNLVVFIYVCV